MTPTSLATLGQIVARVLEMYGLDGPAMFKRHGIDTALLSNPNARIPSRTWDSLARDSAAHIPDPAFGLLAARCWHPSNLGALGYAWLTSSTLRTGLGRVVRYWRLLGEASSTRLQESSAGLTIVLARQAPDPVSSAVTVDFVMSLLVDMCRMNAGSSLRPVAVRRGAGDEGQRRISAPFRMRRSLRRRRRQHHALRGCRSSPADIEPPARGNPGPDPGRAAGTPRQE